MVPGTRVKCYKIPPDNDLCLCEDIFQQHQAKLVNCDSEDAVAISRSRQDPGVSGKRMKKSVQFNKSKVDFVRFQRKDQGTDAMSPRWINRSLDNLNYESEEEDRFAGWVPLPGMKKCKSDFYLSSDGQWRMLDDEENDIRDVFSEEIRVYNLGERQTECYREVLEDIVSSTSTSDCGCDNGSISPKSTESSSMSSATLTVKPNQLNKTPSPDLTTDDKPSSKLSAEERDRALRELDEIVSGSFLKKITDFSNGVSNNENSRSRMSEFLLDMLKLDLTSFKNESSNDQSDPKSSSSSEDETIQFGCGRVAALAKHFSRMGEAGIIRGRGGNFSGRGKGRGLMRNDCKSEPNIASLSRDWPTSPKQEELIIPATTEDNTSTPHFHMVFTSFGLHPIGFSMDRLLDVGKQGVVLEELDSEHLEEDISNKVACKGEHKNTIEDIILEGNYDNPLDEKLLNTKSRTRNLRLHSWTQTSDSIDLVNDDVPENNSSNQDVSQNIKKPLKHNFTTSKQSSLSLDNFASGLSKPKPIDLKKKSISVDEVELKNNRKTLQKHFSLVDLGHIDTASNQEQLEDDKVGVMSSVGCKRLNGFRERRGNFCTSEEISKQYGLKEGVLKDVRKWLSVDDCDKAKNILLKAEKLDTGTLKDNLRKIHRNGDGMGRKLKRTKKIDQKMFVVSPWRHSEVTPREGVLTVLSSDEDCTHSWNSRRNSVPASLLASQVQEPTRKL